MGWKCFANKENNSNCWRPPKVNATACSQTGCSRWLGASAGAVPLRSSGCRNLALPERL